MSMTRLEQETIILYNQAEGTADVYTHDPTLLSKLERLAGSYPNQVVRGDAHHFTVPKRCVSVREPYSEARRAAARERAKRAGNKPPIRSKCSANE